MLLCIPGKPYEHVVQLVLIANASVGVGLLLVGVSSGCALMMGAPA